MKVDDGGKEESGETRAGDIGDVIVDCWLSDGLKEVSSFSAIFLASLDDGCLSERAALGRFGSVDSARRTRAASPRPDAVNKRGKAQMIFKLLVDS